MCIFCQIAQHQAPAEIVYENERVIVFKDIRPSAPVHLLIVPKKHIDSVNHLTKEDKDLIAEMILIGQKVAKEQGVAEKGYKLIFNVGRGGGQLIDHLHLHLMAGWKKPVD